ncbi:metallophosphoesterase [Actinoplanes sp. NPDC026670]|uniref:metallophosphoesterase family protein n=1 Tax=Actinoplanes sp. NPDC026670 TaxID=3154700 RepID=UPI0033F1094C
MGFSLSRRRRRHTGLIAGLLAAVLLPTAGYAALSGDTDPKTGPTRTTVPQVAADADGELIAAVGDIACAPTNQVYRGGEGSPAGCRESSVADLLAGQRLAAFLPLGDLQYEKGRAEEFINVYDQFFGPYKSISRPVPGNHEYQTLEAAGYYGYFGKQAEQENTYGVPGAYSYDIGSWHMIAVNSNLCSPQNRCDKGSKMMNWLKADMAAHPNKCTLAYWHHPLWSAGHHGDYAPLTPVWNALLDGGVDVVLVSHDHNYQRFVPLGKATANSDSAMAPPVAVAENEGIRQFIVGTGGANNYDVADDTHRPDLAGKIDAKYADTSVALFGMLFMRLAEGSYTWEFVQAQPAPVDFHDAGTGTCR